MLCTVSVVDIYIGLCMARARIGFESMRDK